MPVSSAIIEMLPFRKYFKKIGRVYIGQSIALIDLCRYLVEKYLDSDDQNLQMYHSVPYLMNHIVALNTPQHLGTCRRCATRRGRCWEEQDFRS
jgi:hypothetical protein